MTTIAKKFCKACERVKKVHLFYAAPESPDGFTAKCIVCIKRNLRPVWRDAEAPPRDFDVVKKRLRTEMRIQGRKYALRWMIRKLEKELKAFKD
jgi:hypothetical protein